MNNKFNKGIFNKLKSVDKRTLMRTFFWLVAALTILANMVTIILIFRKSHLNRVRLFIIANMCVADIILPSGMCMGLLQVLLRNDVAAGRLVYDMVAVNNNRSTALGKCCNSCYHKRNKVTQTISRIIISALLLGISKYTNHVRKKHIKEITRRKNYFVDEKEKLNKYRRLKILDSFRFYIVTIIVLILLTIAEGVEFLMIIDPYLPKCLLFHYYILHAF